MAAGAPRLYHLLARAQHAVRQQIERRAQEVLGITVSQAGALFHLVNVDGCLHKELATALGILPAAVSGLVARLEANGLVQRRPSRNDGRAELLHATALGKRTAAEALPIAAEMQAVLTAGFSAAEIAVVARFLTAAIEREIWPAAKQET
jgi:DNA-binding MarR family transcriptional regulator